jgi:hypothetical protein
LGKIFNTKKLLIFKVNEEVIKNETNYIFFAKMNKNFVLQFLFKKFLKKINNSKIKGKSSWNFMDGIYSCFGGKNFTTFL